MNSNNSNIYNPASPKTDNAFNSTKSFADNARFVTSEDEATANANLELLIKTTKETIANE